MRKLLLAAILGVFFLGSCAQNKEKREEVKEDLSAEHMRNSGADSAVAATSAIDSTQAVKDSAQ